MLQIGVHICTPQCEVPRLIKSFCLDVSHNSRWFYGRLPVFFLLRRWKGENYIYHYLAVAIIVKIFIPYQILNLFSLTPHFFVNKSFKRYIDRLNSVLYFCVCISTIRSRHIALMMEAVRISEALVKLYQSRRSCNPEDSHLHTHSREMLESFCWSFARRNLLWWSSWLTKGP
jgi:hypothetical protein